MEAFPFMDLPVELQDHVFEDCVDGFAFHRALELRRTCPAFRDGTEWAMARKAALESTFEEEYGDDEEDDDFACDFGDLSGNFWTLSDDFLARYMARRIIFTGKHATNPVARQIFEIITELHKTHLDEEGEPFKSVETVVKFLRQDSRFGKGHLIMDRGTHHSISSIFLSPEFLHHDLIKVATLLGLTRYKNDILREAKTEKMASMFGSCDQRYGYFALAVQSQNPVLIEALMNMYLSYGPFNKLVLRAKRPESIVDRTVGSLKDMDSVLGDTMSRAWKSSLAYSRLLGGLIAAMKLERGSWVQGVLVPAMMEHLPILKVGDIPLEDWNPQLLWVEDLLLLQDWEHICQDSLADVFTSKDIKVLERWYLAHPVLRQGVSNYVLLQSLSLAAEHRAWGMAMTIIEDLCSRRESRNMVDLVPLENIVEVLFATARAGRVDILDDLLAKCPPLWGLHELLPSFLLEGAKYGREEVVDYLLPHCMDRGSEDFQKAVLVAAFGGYTSILHRFHQHGVDLRRRQICQMTPMEAAVLGKQWHTANMLFSLNSPPALDLSIEWLVKVQSLGGIISELNTLRAGYKPGTPGEWGIRRNQSGGWVLAD